MIIGNEKNFSVACNRYLQSETFQSEKINSHPMILLVTAAGNKLKSIMS